MKNDYIPIKEFADKVGVSTQAIYQRIDKDLQSYLKIENGKKLLNIKGLELFNVKETFKDSLQQIDKQLYNTLQDTLNTLKEQIEAKDRQLNEQRYDYIKQLEAKDLQIERLQKSNENNQILIAQTQERVKQLEAPKEEPVKEKRNFLDMFFKGKGQ